MIPVDHSNRRHTWKTTDGRHARCERCGARVRVSVDITDAGIRAAVERHGPAKCPGKSWWNLYASWYHQKPEPPPPWQEPSSGGRPVRPELEVGSPEAGHPVGRVQEADRSADLGPVSTSNAATRSATATRPSKATRSATTSTSTKAARSATATRPSKATRSATATRPKPSKTKRGAR